jgi:hypothetical protein
MDRSTDVQTMPNLGQLLSIGLLGLAAPLFFVGLTVGAGLSWESVLEPDKYVRTAIGLLERGEYVEFLDGQWRPSLERLPAYPTILALIFAVFGSGNYVAVVLFQTGMAAATVVGTALCAREIDVRWMWPAAILAAICPNLAYRAATVMPETAFHLFLVWGLWCCLRASAAKQPLKLLLIAGALLGFAFMTRPAMLLFPFIAYPGLVYLLKRSGRSTWTRSFGMALLPMVIIGGFASTQFYRTYQAHGHASFTVQSGVHAMRFVYPCLAREWGCGQPYPETIRKSQEALTERIANLSEAELRNPVLVDKVTRALAIDLILEIPISRLLSSISGGAAKLMLHTSYTEILSNFGLDPLFFSEISGDSFFYRVKTFLRELFSDPYMVPWPIIMGALLLARVTQIGGIVGGLVDPDYRPKILFLSLSAASLLATTIGIGNPRYRSPLEPVLIILAVAGADMMWQQLQYWQRRLH